MNEILINEINGKFKWIIKHKNGTILSRKLFNIKAEALAQAVWIANFNKFKIERLPDLKEI